MLHDKDIKNISELSTSFCSTHNNSDFFSKLINVLKIGKFHSIFSSAKQKGFSGLSILRILLVFPFIGEQTVHSFSNSHWREFFGYGKDVYYRLKNNSKINWRKLLFGVVKQVIALKKERLTNASNENKKITAFIFDDTCIPKTGFQIEGGSRIWNHVIQKSIFGFQLLVMGLYDGSIFIPINFSFHREKGRKKRFGLTAKQWRKQKNKKRLKSTPGAERKKALDSSKIESAVKMIKQAVANGIKADYILTDSWFTCWKIVKIAIDNHIKYVGMFSKVKTIFQYQGKNQTIAEIRKSKKKKIKRNKKYNLYYTRTVVSWNGTNVVLYFTRKGRNGKWKTILSTDLSADFNKTIETYQIRWTIEVFFKECKQMLALGKSQSEDFDAQIADTTIVMIRYLFLAAQNEVEKYETLGALFESEKNELVELRLHERIILLLMSIIEVIEILFEGADVEELFSKIINDKEVCEQIQRIINPQKYFLKNAA